MTTHQNEPNGIVFSEAARDLRRKTHETIKSVTQDMDNHNFNTAISSLMELSNAIRNFKCTKPAEDVEPTSQKD